MKNLKIFTAVLITATLFATSCSIEKRHFNKGYHISWKNNKTKKTDQVNSNDEQLAQTNTQQSVNDQNTEEKEHLASNKQANKESSIKKNNQLEKRTKKSMLNEKVNTSVSEKSSEETVAFSDSKLKNHFNTQLVLAKKIARNASENSGKDKTSDTTIIIALILCFFLPPLAVWLAYGGGSEFTLNLLLFLGAIILPIIGAILGLGSAATGSGAGLGIGTILILIGGILGFVSFIHALIKVIQML